MVMSTRELWKILSMVLGPARTKTRPLTCCGWRCWDWTIRNAKINWYTYRQSINFQQAH